MNTEGHRRIADEVGLPVLVAAFRARGYKRLPLNAFPLGNWLTDVQQAVDPVAADPELTKKQINDLANEIVSSLYVLKSLHFRAPGGDPLAGWVGNLPDSAIRVVQHSQRSLVGAIDLLFAPTSAPRDPRRTRVFDALRTLFRILGYFKFVHPVTASTYIRLDHEPSSGNRMNIDAYFAVYDKMFKQYYPHDHLDRPELRNPPQTPPNYRSEVADGPRAQGQSKLKPDLYEYLREDIQTAAGRLAHVEVDFASAMFDARQPPRPDDVAWNLSLARLGRALHAVEDFFAHSNFTEWAVTILGVDYQPKSVIHRRILDLRLKRWQPILPDPPAEEKNVVTGWFDLKDTLISLGHAMELAFGIRLRDPQVRVAEALDTARQVATRPDILLFDIQQLLYETSELLDDPKKALQDRDNSVAQQIRDRIPVTALGQPVTKQTVVGLLQGSPVFQSVPPQVKTDIVNALVLLHGAYKVGSTTYTTYKAIKSVYRFIQNPLGTAKGWIRSAIGDAAAEVIGYYAQDRIETFLGRNRIGCHSLLAKDHDEAALHDPAWNLAAGVHWYVMSVLTRRHPDMPPSPQQGQKVDWFDLLEFFLRHPKGGLNLIPTPGDLCVPIIHIVEDNTQRFDSLATLEDRYKSTFCGSGQFSWRTIADANFDTGELKNDRDKQRVINNILKVTGKGYLVRDRINYAFKRGVPVIIPDQRRRIEVYRLEEAPTTWWREVLTRGTWKVFPGYADPEGRMTASPIKVGYTPRRLSPDQVRSRLSAADQREDQQEKSYR
jgi:Heterokaryon incompatibility protein Het-C